MTTLPLGRRDRALLAILYVALAVVLSHAHAVRIDQPNRARNLERHADVLRNGERDPYQYKLWTISWAIEGVHRATGADVFKSYLVNGFLAVLALLLAHHRWLGALYGTREALLGTLLLAALAHGQFLGYQHHPYDLWGLAGFCLLLHAMACGASLPRLCLLALATGLVWEKHALLPVVYGVMALKAGRRLVPTALRSAAYLACCLAIPVAIRLVLGTNRDVVDDTSFTAQHWGKAIAHHAPFVLPFLAILVVRWDRVPPLVRWLWLYVPVLFAAYLANRLMIEELRSFWAFVPVFTATACAWSRDLPSPSP